MHKENEWEKAKQTDFRYVWGTADTNMTILYCILKYKSENRKELADEP